MQNQSLQHSPYVVEGRSQRLGRPEALVLVLQAQEVVDVAAQSLGSWPQVPRLLLGSFARTGNKGTDSRENRFQRSAISLEWGLGQRVEVLLEVVHGVPRAPGRHVLEAVGPALNRESVSAGIPV